MSQAVGHLPPTMEALFSLGSVHGTISAGQGVTGTCFPLSTQGFLCHSHSTSLPFSFIHLSPSLHYFFHGLTALVGLGLLIIEVLS